MHGINKGVKEPTHGCQKYNTSQILIFGGYLKVRESLCTQVIIWVDTILNHSDIVTYEGSCMLYRPK